MTLEDGHWAKIATWQQLQRLLNDLVFYESQGQGILPSSPHIGADGGWDGKFVGTLFGHDLDQRLALSIAVCEHIWNPQRVLSP